MTLNDPAGDATLDAAISAVQGTTPDADLETPPDQVPAEGEGTGTPDDGAPETPDAEPAPTDAGSDKLQQLIDTKYGGDRDKFLEGLYEQWNSTSRIAQEVKELRTQLTEKAAPPLEQHPDIQLIVQEVRDLESSYNSNEQQQQSLLTEIDKHRQEAARLDGRLEKAEEGAEKINFSNQKHWALQQAQSLAREWRELGATNRSILTKRASLIRQAEGATQQLQQQRSLAQKQAVLEEAAKEDTRKEFFTSVVNEAQGFGVTPNTKAFNHMLNTIKAELTYHLRSLPDDAPGVDIESFVKSRAKEYGEVLNLSKTKNFKQFTADKLDSTGKPAIPAKPAGQQVTQARRGIGNLVADEAAKIKIPDKITAKFARERAARLLS